MGINFRQLLLISFLLVLSISLWIWIDDGEQKSRLKSQLESSSTIRHSKSIQRRQNPVNRHGLFLPGYVHPTINSKSGYILSVNVADEYLFDAKLGLLAKERKQEHLRTRLKGRQWEYPASAILYYEGEVVSEGIVGLRTHGSVKSATKESFLSEECGTRGGRDFRLYNRSGVRLVNFPDELFSGRLKRAQRTLVVRRKKAVRNYFAYKIAELIGAEIPANGLVQFEINGKQLCTALISEHISARQFASDITYGGAFHRFKDPFGKSIEYYKLSEWLKTKPAYDEISSIIDIENFTAHIFSIYYLGNRDWVQGAAIKPSADGKWKWVLWDLDTTFRQSEFKIAAMPLFSRRKYARAILFNLLIELPEYQQFFRRFIVDRLNHKLSPGDIDKIFRDMDLHQENDIEEAKYIHSVIISRGKDLLEDLNRHIGQRQELVHVNLKSPRNISYSVDNYPRFDSEYTGSYFRGQTVSLSAAADNFVAWNVNGNSRYVRDLELRPTENLEIFAVLEE